MQRLRVFGHRYRQVRHMLLASQSKCYFLKTIHFLSRVPYKNLLLNPASFHSKWGFFDELKGVVQKFFRGLPPPDPYISVLLALHARTPQSLFRLDPSLEGHLIILCYSKSSYQSLAPPLFRSRRRPCFTTANLFLR